MQYENDLSAQYTQKKQNARFSQTYEHKKRSKGAGASQGKGQIQTVGLILSLGKTGTDRGEGTI
jgi:hypothetical protein